MGALEARLARPALSWRETAAAYVALTKPRIISLLLITTIPTMILAADGVPSLWLIVATLAGGTLAAGGANAINCYVDRDIDEVMHRTQGRPLPMGKVDPTSALVFAVALEVAAFVLLAVAANLLAAVLAASAAAFYVFVYTLWLKRSTPQNIVIGGAAGAVPPLVGWAAVRGDIGLPALVLFAVVFLWTPPHFWALSIKYRDDYERAGVPMLPVVATLRETKRQIFIYALLLVPASLLLLATGAAGWIYGVTAGVLGAMFAWQAWRLRADDRPGAAMGVFSFSILYLTLVFLAAGADVLILG
ncbi:MAG TPA: heme o synthase [Dehalococcoidia bacterium]|jgi:protoheme IX farnesyltransferase|nr:heme o synthase [Dehalococcoidia bacterium]